MLKPKTLPRKITSRGLVLLISGCPGVGKSTLAFKLATALGIDTVIQTDTVKEIFRLFNSSFIACGDSHDIWQLLGSASPENVITGFKLHTSEYTDLLLKILQAFISLGRSVIVEGVQATPDLYSRIDYSGKLGLYFRMLPQKVQLARFDSKNRARSVRHAKWYANYPYMKIIDSYQEKLARKNNYLVLENTSADMVVDHVLDYLNSKGLIDQSA